MQFNLSKNLEKIVTAFDKMSNLPKALMKYGCIVFLVLLTVGSVMALLNITVLNFDSNLDFVSKSLVKTSFSIAAEAVIGGLILDFVFKK
ncbi:MAG: hypothetical protein FIA99_16670 [Ruminiclostridium sp.]|nr:hypothetical protein [Ruminiclostridium sp.]